MNRARPDDSHRISASSFDVSVAPVTGATAAATRQRTLMIAAAVVLGLGALFVVAVLPRLVGGPASPTAPRAQQPAPSGAESPASETVAVPETANDPQARSDTQQQLRDTLEQIAQLEAMQAEQWARAELHALRQRVADGEAAYREKRYVAAQNIYVEVRRKVDRLLTEVPDIVGALLDAGELALDTDRSADAVSAFEQVLAMAPDNARARRGLERARSLDQVNALIAQAEGYEALGQVDKATAAYREALALDADAAHAAGAIARIERDQRQQRFMREMSAGFAALDKGSYDRARKAFNRAKAIDPGSEEVAEALAQLENRAASAAIERNLASARKAEAAEDWDQALKAFEAALAVDARLSPAIAGKQRAARRRELDAALIGYLARPQRLSDAAVHEQASAVLARAQALGSSDRRLTQQIGQLGRQLELARTPVSVRFVSDQATRVTVYRVGELGTFASHTLDLLPGSYTVVGQRDGYRDVRVEFAVSHAASPQQVDVRCVDKLAFGS